MKRDVISRVLLSAVSLFTCVVFAVSCGITGADTPQTKDPTITTASQSSEESQETTSRVTMEPTDETVPVTESTTTETTSPAVDTEPVSTPETLLVESYFSPNQMWYLKRSAEAVNETEDTVELPAGTVILDAEAMLNEDNSVDICFNTFDGEALRIPVEISGEKVLVQGEDLYRFVGGQEDTADPSYPIPAVTGRDVTLNAWDILYRPYYYGSITFWCDWNKDGITDMLLFDIKGGNKIFFRDGATSEETVLDGIFAEPAEAIMLCENSRGEYAILLLAPFTWGSEPTVYSVYQYDPDLKFTLADDDYFAYQGFFDYREGQFYIVYNGSSFPGGYWCVEEPATMDDDFRIVEDFSSGTYIEGGSIFTYTYVDAPAERWNGSSYEACTIPAGTVFFPTRYEFLEEREGVREGYLYFKTYEGERLRITLEYSETEDYQIKLAGMPQNTFCYCMWGD